jgi:hypothetical protein
MMSNPQMQQMQVFFCDLMNYLEPFFFRMASMMSGNAQAGSQGIEGLMEA